MTAFLIVPGVRLAAQAWLRATCVLLALGISASPSHALESAEPPLQIDPESIDRLRAGVPIDYPAISADRRSVAVVRNPDPKQGSLVVEIHDVRSLAVTQRFELLSPEEGTRPLSEDVLKALHTRVLALNGFFVEHGFRAMPLLYVSEWQRDLAFNETFDSGLFRVVLQHPTGSLRIASTANPAAVFERLQPALPLASMPDCLANAIPIEGWFDASGVGVLRHIHVPRETCARADTWSVVQLPDAGS